MYIMGENPAMSDPDLNHAREALAHLEHLVVQDLFLTETAVYADVVLPASGWPEKDGTVTNTNRQVQMGRQALPLPGEARHDWWITQEIAHRIGLRLELQAPSEIYTEMASMMPALDNISWERVERERRRHLSGRRARPAGPRRGVRQGLPAPGRLRQAGRGEAHAAGRGARRRVSVHPHHRPPARALAHRRDDAARHGARRARAAARSRSCRAAPSPSSASRRATWCASPRAAARSSSPRARTMRCRTASCSSRSPIVEAAANLLTNPALDPFGKIPEFKFCAAKVEAVDPVTRVAAE